MSEPFLGEVKIVGFNFAPRGWATCDGQLLPINQNQSLYSLLGTAYGGDGRTTFALPDLRGRTPTHVGDGYQWGQKGGAETQTLNVNEIPAHTHPASASGDATNAPVPAGNILATPSQPLYVAPANLKQMHASSVSSAGDGQAHDNMQPYTVLNFVIALRGLFPPRN
jgi:microcystin-dependent protein